jgi:NADH-quinone oxidoreductase subunit C
MNELLQPVVQALGERFDALVVEHLDQVSLMVKPEHIVEGCHLLRDEFCFERLSGLSAVDYWPQLEPRFHVIYQLQSISKNVRLGLRVPVNGSDPCLPTIEGIYPNANWHERETWDMFGIRFEGHSDLRRILMPEDWIGHPLRKDYPLGYEEVRFSFNPDVDKRKPHPKE